MKTNAPAHAPATKAAPEAAGQARQRLPAAMPWLQRACACGGSAGLGGTCDECRRHKRLGLQARPLVNRPGDRWEREAERAAETLMRRPPATEGRHGPRLPGTAPAARPVNGLSEPVQRAAGSTRAGTQPAGEAEMAQQLANLPGGQPLRADERGFFEAGYGHDFGAVRLHTGPQAARLARSVEALAFTRGRDIVFGAGQYAPQAAAGQRLLAHELAHVVQQGAAPAAASPASAPVAGATRSHNGAMVLRSYGTAKPDEVGHRTIPTPTAKIGQGPDGRAEEAEEDETERTEPGLESAGGERPPEIQRQDGGTPPPAPATPTLTLTPGNALTRAGNLTAAVNFTPNAGERLNVTGWDYTTPSHGSVTRPTTDANFQTQWAGIMALTGTLRLSFTVTPSGGAAGATQTLDQPVTVNDRTGAPFASTVTDNAETSRTGQPSPPRLFRELGVHNSNVTNPTPTTSAISAGPNSGFTFVSTVSNGTYTSTPAIHPDVTNATGAFRTFHNASSVLFKVNATTGAKTRIPVTEYSNFTQTPLAWDVPDWAQFYKRHGIFTVQASANGNTVTVANANWGLDNNAHDGNVQITNEAAVRAQLGIGASDAFSVSVTVNFSWQGFALMPSAAIPGGVRSHEFQHAVHSHRANFHKMMRALDPQKLMERAVSTPSNTVDFNTRLTELQTEILAPNHEIVDEGESARQERFVATAGQEMAGVNTDPATSSFLGNVWDITGNQPMT